MSTDDETDNEYVIEGDPRTEVYISTQGNICVSQTSGADDVGEIVYFSADDAEKVIGFMRECVTRRRAGFIPEDDGDDEEDEEADELEDDIEEDDEEDDDEDEDDEEEEEAP